MEALASIDTQFHGTVIVSRDHSLRHNRYPCSSGSDVLNNEVDRIGEGRSTRVHCLERVAIMTVPCVL